MSRIGRLPIQLPDGVSFSVSKGTTSISGPRGKMTLGIPDGISIKKQDDMVVVTRMDDSREQKRLHGVTRAHLANKIKGVSEGHSIKLIIEGKGYQGSVINKCLEMQIGFSHRVVVELPEGITADVKPGQNQFTLILSGNEKQLVGSIASTIYNIKPVEPYNLTGIRYADRSVRRKAPKAAVTTT